MIVEDSNAGAAAPVSPSVLKQCVDLFSGSLAHFQFSKHMFENLRIAQPPEPS